MRAIIFSANTKRIIAALVASSALLAIPTAVPSIQASGDVETVANVSNTDSVLSEAPQISVNNGMYAISWGERSKDSIGTIDGLISNDPSGQKIFKTGTNTSNQWPDIAVGSNGTEHLAYAVENSIFYRQRTRGGTWSSAIKVASDDFPNPVRIAVAPNGTIWAIWRNNEGTHIGFRYSDNDGAGWTGGDAGGIVATDQGNMFAPDIAIGPDNMPHVVWHIREHKFANSGEISYADWDGSSWSRGKLTNDGDARYDEDAVIAIDGNNIQHVAWRKFVGEKNFLTYAYRAPNESWKGFTTLGQSNESFQYAPGIGSDAAGSVFITISAVYDGGRRVFMTHKLSSDSSWSKLEKASDGKRNWETRNAVAAESSNGAIRAHFVYQSETRGSESSAEIYYKRYRYAGTSIAGEPTINNGAASFNSESVSVTFDKVVGSPNQVRWRWGAEPSDAASDSNGWQIYANPLTVPRPSNITSASCLNLSLFVQLRNGSNLSSIKSDSILFDNTVQASIDVLNPHLDGKLATFSQGASAGENNNTRENFYQIRLTDTGDCTGLRGYGFNSGSETNWPTDSNKVELQNGFIAGTLPGSRPPLTTYITDKTGNRLEQSNVIVYDPRNGNENQSPNAGVPQVITGTFTISPSNSLLQKLDFSNVQVNDAVYGAAANLPTGSQFWGVWVATSQGNTPLDPSEYNSETLQWTPIRVNQRGSTFSVTYPLLSGRSGGDISSHAGTYWVYVKFLDGAGNPSVETLAPQKVELTSDYSLITAALPLNSR